MPFAPTGRLAALAFVATGVAIAAGFLPQARTALWSLDAVLLLSALIDLLLTLGPRVEVERQTAAIFSVGRANVITLRLRNRRRRPMRGEVTDDPIPDARSQGIPGKFTLPANGEIALQYEVTPSRRGPRELRAVTLRHRGPLGLMLRQERTELPAHVSVYPDVHAARMLEMLRRQGRQDARLGSLRVRGGDTEFERLRPYVRGDEVRHVDWRATARRDDVTVRQYQAESNQNVVFALDIGRGMRGESAGLTSIDHALNAALLAADVALRGGDKAGLLAFDDEPRTFLPPTGGRTGARKLTNAVHALDAGLSATDYRAALMFLRTQVRTRSLVIVFTHLLETRSAKELASSLRGLLPRHLPLCVLMRDMEIEALAVAPASSEDDLYVRASAAETLSARDALIRSLRNAGVLVLDAPPHEVTPSLVKSYLEIKARRLL